MNQHYPFALLPLPYPYDALTPYIDERTLHFHHDKHLATYVDNLNKALEPYPMYHDWTLEQLVTSYATLPMEIRTPVRNNAGGVYNHQLYFELMGPEHNTPHGEVLSLINKWFDTYDNFKDLFKKSALAVFGSGWTYLVRDKFGDLHIVNTPNQDTPLPNGYTPILVLDVWEHAYYLQYQNLRANYIDAWFNVINWNKVNALFDKIKK